MAKIMFVEEATPPKKPETSKATATEPKATKPTTKQTSTKETTKTTKVKS